MYLLMHFTDHYRYEKISSKIIKLNSNELFSCVNHYNLQMDSDLLIQELQKGESKRLSTANLIMGQYIIMMI